MISDEHDVLYMFSIHERKEKEGVVYDKFLGYTTEFSVNSDKKTICYKLNTKGGHSGAKLCVVVKEDDGSYGLRPVAIHSCYFTNL
jgi:hypothetical protein